MHPIIFSTNFFTLYTFWIFFAVAVIIGTFALIRSSIIQGLKLQFLSEKSFYIIFWSIIGARLAFIIAHLPIYFQTLNLNTIFNLFAVWDKGLYLWGGLLAALIYLYRECRKNEQDFWKWLDAIIPALIIALAIGHLGAFFDGMNYGNETSLPWGVNFENPAIKYAVPIHPTQIYAFLYSVLIGTSLFFLSQNSKIKEIEPKGFIGLVGILSYSLFKFLEEFVRGDDTIMIFVIRLPQIVTFAILITTGIIFYRRYNRPNKKAKLKST